MFNKYLKLKSIKFLQSLSTAGNFSPTITIALSRVTLNYSIILFMFRCVHVRVLKNVGR